MSEIKNYEGNLILDGKRFGIVVGRFNAFVVESLVEGAIDTLKRHGAKDAEIEVFRVPGAYEIPLMAQRMAKSGKYDAIIALGAVIRGGTPHFDYVCDAVTTGLTRVALDTGVPMGFGVLTCDNEHQALDRAGLPGSTEDKGREAAEAALATALTLRSLRTP